MKEEYYMTAEQFKGRYDIGIIDEANILYMLMNCRNNVSRVSAAMDFGISYANLIDLCAGFVYGSAALKSRILDFLDDINFHYESSELGSNIYRDRFIKNVLNHNSDYVKKYWDFIR